MRFAVACLIVSYRHRRIRARPAARGDPSWRPGVGHERIVRRDDTRYEDPTSTTSSFMGVNGFSNAELQQCVDRDGSGAAPQEFTVSGRKLGIGLEHAVDHGLYHRRLDTAAGGVLASCATSVVRRRSSSRSLLSRLGHGIERFAETGYLAIVIEVHVRARADISLCYTLVMAFAVLVMRLMGPTRLRANRKPMHEASRMAMAAAKNMAW